VTIERTYYTVRELKEQGGNGFYRALDEYAQQECEWQDWSDEWASLKALDALTGYTRDRYRAYRGGLAETADLTGRRAWAWLENVVLTPLRVGWLPIAKRGRYTRPGRVPDCPFTGFYMDEVLLDDLRDSLRSGMSVGDAMLALEGKVQRVIDEELDYRTSEEAFIERAENEGWEFTGAGERA
jgi:hypothetical protein